ncbi:hypothetical protein PVAR5_5566 [Paecilomyces variotii No. 5]|uniref:Uncharacterized protein n=1 Tax=Byssochlamys spectabilis (strain No. 5 / NBRC 109023) TaxID=1356009 RepID=V5I251_BYSSN|nr:hypothetical protein PVAR5_5566 [Paecilomyces variotii No. 5]
MSTPRLSGRLQQRLGDRPSGIPRCSVNPPQQRDRQFRRLHSCLHPANPPPPPPPVDRSNLTVHRPFLNLHSGRLQRREEQPANPSRSSPPPTSQVPVSRIPRRPVRPADPPVLSAIREDVAARRPFLRRTQRLEERPAPVPRPSTFQRSQLPISRAGRLHSPESRPADPPARALEQQNKTVRRSVFRSSSKLAPRVPVRPAPRPSVAPSDEPRPQPDIVAPRALYSQSSASQRAVPQESAGVFELRLAERKAAREARPRPWSLEGKSSLPRPARATAKGSFSTVRQPVSSLNDPTLVSAPAHRTIAPIRSAFAKPALSKEDVSGSEGKGRKSVRFGDVTVQTVSRWIYKNKHVFEGA